MTPFEESHGTKDRKKKRVILDGLEPGSLAGTGLVTTMYAGVMLSKAKEW